MNAFMQELQMMMSDAHLAKELDIEQKRLIEIAQAEEWKERSQDILDSIPIQVTKVAELAADYFHALKMKLPDNWPETVYRLMAHRLFPGNFNDEVAVRVKNAALFTMDMVGLFLKREEAIGGFQEELGFQGLAEDAFIDSANSAEYSRLKDAWDYYYIQEILRLGREIQYYDLLAHISGVHRVAVTVGSQLREAGVAVDLPLLSGAAMVHDIGKYGCRNEAEIRRMAYLHYYYTEQWCLRQNLPTIGHIAMNHSTWDLELENLSVESLLLIYSDFRVKADQNRRDEREVMKIYGLDESFSVILNKLDNVDEKKRQRYQRVYNKLSDFEDYLTAFGVDVSLGDRRAVARRPAWYGLLDAKATPKIFKDLAFDHNIKIMHVLSDPDYLRNMLEALRASGQSVDIRANLNIFEEYITYMTRSQKELIASYLMDMLTHQEGDIRRQASRLVGQLIAHFDERYSKWLPEGSVHVICGTRAVDLWEELLKRVFKPDHKLADRYRRYQGYAFQNILSVLLSEVDDEDAVAFLTPLMRYYRDSGKEPLTAFILLDVLSEIPMRHLNERDQRLLLRFALTMFACDDVEIRLALLRFLEIFVAEQNTLPEFSNEVLSALRRAKTLWSGEAYLNAQIEALISGGYPKAIEFRPSSVFLENLKSSTPWQVKAVNIRRLADALVDNPTMNRLHVALHFSNLLKVSEQVAVRHYAGQMLVQIAPLLTPEEVNEVVVELCRGLEMDSFEFTKYIPEYLARFAANLKPTEYDEFIDSLGILLDAQNATVAQLALDTLAHSAAIYDEYSIIEESPSHRRERLSLILGFLMKGLASYHTSVCVETLSALGHILFGNSHLSLAYKCELFDILYKRLLMLFISDEIATKEVFYGHCATLNHLYRFISDYIYEYGELPLYENKKVAFFPGTFDPFTLGHKEIVRTIRDQGFEVFLALDEFSWSKNTQPAQIRRSIMQMSIASEENVMIFPPIFPVNLASSEDLERLENLFKAKTLYLVVGSDVLRGASAYQGPRENNSVHQFNHIVVSRQNDGFTDEMRNQALNRLDGDVIEFTLPALMEDVSSTVIRKNIDKNRDISHLIDRMVQNYIYEHNLYLGETKKKPIKNPNEIDIAYIKAEGGALWSDIEGFLSVDDERQTLAFLSEEMQPESRLISVREQGRLMGLALVQISPSLDIYQALGHRAMAAYAREQGAATIAVISRFSLRKGNERSAQRVMANALMWASEQNATLAIYHGHGLEEKEQLEPILSRHGFLTVPIGDDTSWFSMVKLSMPIVISDNVRTFLKEPFLSMTEVQQVIFECHCHLQEALTSFHPGELVLSYDALNLEAELAKIISQENQVPAYQGEERVLGEAICVPYGHLLRSAVVPNTVTRPLYVQRLYHSGMLHAEVTPLPYYDRIVSQVKTLHSFKRPVILTDEVLNRGKTFERLVEVLKEKEVPIQCVACGIITGNGLDILRDHELRAQYVHHLPNLRYWLTDSKGYPFLDGFSRADRPIHVMRGLETSINPVLPYAAPPLFSESGVEAAWKYSQVSLSNALQIMRTIERAYQKENERNLTLHRLPEVFARPMLPDPGVRLTYDLTLNPSWYIRQDLARLDYFTNIIPKEEG